MCSFYIYFYNSTLLGLFIIIMYVYYVYNMYSVAYIHLNICENRKAPVPTKHIKLYIYPIHPN